MPIRSIEDFPSSRRWRQIRYTKLAWTTRTVRGPCFNPVCAPLRPSRHSKSVRSNDTRRPSSCYQRNLGTFALLRPRLPDTMAEHTHTALGRDTLDFCMSRPTKKSMRAGAWGLATHRLHSASFLRRPPPEFALRVEQGPRSDHLVRRLCVENLSSHFPELMHNCSNNLTKRVPLSIRETDIR